MQLSLTRNSTECVATAETARSLTLTELLKYLLQLHGSFQRKDAALLMLIRFRDVIMLGRQSSSRSILQANCHNRGRVTIELGLYFTTFFARCLTHSHLKLSQ
jgi:hypothetical protein